MRQLKLRQQTWFYFLTSIFYICVVLMVGCASESIDQSSNIVECPDFAVESMQLTVVDEEGNEITDATVTVTDGDFSRNLEFWDDDEGVGYYGQLWERAGTYQLTVEKEGYVTHIEEVVVTSTGGICSHVITEQVEVVLELEE